MTTEANLLGSEGLEYQWDLQNSERYGSLVTGKFVKTDPTFEILGGFSRCQISEICKNRSKSAKNRKNRPKNPKNLKSKKKNLSHKKNFFFA